MLTRKLTRRITQALTRKATEPGSGGTAIQTMTIEVASGYLYARFPWDEANDAVQAIKVTADTPSMSATGVVQPWGIKKIPASTPRENIASAFASSVDFIAYQGDDPPPVKYNNTFIGGNHGPAVSVKVTCTVNGTDPSPHGKTFADIGSQWQDSSGNNCWIIEIISPTELTFMRNNIGSNAEQWFFYASLDAGTMTHVAGATNQASFTAKQWPSTREINACLRDMVRDIKLNGTDLVTADGVYDCNYVAVVESYEIVNPASMLSYFIAGRPWASTPSMTDPSIAGQALVQHTHEIRSNGSMSTIGRVEFLQSVSMFDGTGYVSFAQAQPITWEPGVGSLQMYIPRLGDVVGGVKTWKFSDVETISGTFESLDFTTSTWSSPTNPPDRMVQIRKDGTGTKEYGFVIGYSRLSGSGQALDEWDGVSSSWVSSARKMYLRAMTRGASALGLGLYDPIPTGAIVEATAYRIPYNLANIQEATTAAVRMYDGGAEVIVDFHESVSGYAIQVPESLNGKTATIIDGSGLTLDSPTVSGGVVHVTVAGSYGEAVINIA